MQEIRFNPRLHRFTMVVALSALGLIAIGGLVTSHGVGMAVPDWPTSFGYNMFALPFSLWLTGGVFHEHTHRQWASIVGVLVVVLMRWVGGRKACLPLLIIGGIELLAGFALPVLGSEWKGGGYFLSGIGGVVVLAGIVWTRNEPAPGPLPGLGWAAFWLVQLQGLLGGLRVVLDAHVFAGTKLGVVFGIFHGCLGQAFLVLLCVMALMTSRWWLERQASPRNLDCEANSGRAMFGAPARGLVLATTMLIFLQLILGATMRHQHAGLAIWDFPQAHGQWWPDMSAEAIQRYNSERTELVAFNPVTATQVALQMAHRIGAVLILVSVAACFAQLRRSSEVLLKRLSFGWFLLVLGQAGLGAWTIWSNKAADVATLHVVGGALSLVVGSLITSIAFRFNFRCCGAGQNLASHAA